MSNKKKTAVTGNKGSNNGFKGFFNPVLNADIKSAVKALKLGDVVTVERIEWLAQAQLKLSITSDVPCTHFTFSLFDKRSDSNSQGYVLSVKHADFNVGIGLCWFLCSEIYEGGGWLDWIEGTTDLEW